MNFFHYTLVHLGLSLLVPLAYAEETLSISLKTNDSLAQQAPEVGKHVMANMDAGSMIISLLIVLVVIVFSSLILKRFNITQQNNNQLKVVASLSLGTKERLIVTQIGKQQLVLGVTAQQITLLKSLDEPMVSTPVEPSSALASHILNLLQKNRVKTNDKVSTITSDK